MLQTVEAVIEKGSQILFLEPMKLTQARQHVLVTLLNHEDEPLIKGFMPVFVDKKPNINAKEAVARLRALSKGIRWKADDGMSIRDARKEGRRY